MLLNISLILLLSLYSGITSSVIAKQNTQNTNMELTFIKNAMTPSIDKAISRIHVVKSIDSGVGFNGIKTLGDEFNCKATSFTGDIKYILSAALIDVGKHFNRVEYCPSKEPSLCNDETSKGVIIATVSEYGDDFCATKDMLLIDMNGLLNTGITKHTESLKTCQIEAIRVNRSETGKHTIKRAFDGSTKSDDFWESFIEKPIDVDISFYEPRLIDKYFMASGENASRMPISWEFMALDEHNQWMSLDKQVDVRKWSPFENRKFSFANDKNFKRYKFIFTKSPDYDRALRIYEIWFE
ncbi:MAG: hypothetical protein HQL06_02140 [Nitrospirae bacterium]|nr:hypothetical protein [Nitrospirota bacterium]